MEQYEEPMMSSLRIAEVIKREHSDVVKEIRKILRKIDVDERKFQFIYTDSSNKENIYYRLPEFELSVVSSTYSEKHKIMLMAELMSYRKQESIESKILAHQEKKLALEVKRLENDIELNKMLMQITIAKSIKELGVEFNPVELAKGNLVLKEPEEPVNEIRADAEVSSAIKLLIKNKTNIKTKDFIYAMLDANFMEEYIHDKKVYARLVENYHYYGFNRPHEFPTQVLFYEDRFPHLIKLLKSKGYL